MRDGAPSQKSDTPLSLTWRGATPEDTAFLLELTDATIRGYVLESGGMEERIRPWLEERNAVMEWSIVLWNGEPVGAIACKRWPTIIHLLSIHVVPERQGQGIGTAMLQRLLTWADVLQLPIGLEVLKVNPDARRLYERLGFVVGRQDEKNYMMLRQPTEQKR